MIIGVCFYFFLIGFMSTYLNSLDRKGNLLNEKRMIIKQFCQQAGIDQELKENIEQKLKYRTENYYFSLFENNSILEGIPFLLRREIALNIHDKVFQNFCFFTSIDEILLSTLVIHLQPLQLEQGNLIYQRGDIANESNFII